MESLADSLAEILRNTPRDGVSTASSINLKDLASLLMGRPSSSSIPMIQSRPPGMEPMGELVNEESSGEVE